MEPVRIHKYLSGLGIASRREAERWLLEGRIAVNGEVVTTPGLKIDPDADRISIDGKPVTGKAPPTVYWMYHKPDKTLTSRKGEEGKATIFDSGRLRRLPFLVSPVGRLDFRTEGLLILSNDGELVHRLMHPAWKIPREYHVLVNGRLDREAVTAITAGLDCGGEKFLPAEVERLGGKTLGRSRGYWYRIVVREGRNRLIRRMMEHFELKVIRFIRSGFGELNLPENLPPGEYRQLRSEEIRLLKSAARLRFGEKGSGE